MSVKRIYVEKRQGFFDIEAQALCADLTESFGLHQLKAVRIIQRYDIEGLSDAEYRRARNIVFSEPTVDVVYDGKLPEFPNSRMFAMEFLPGQYDQTADSAAQCVQMLTQKERPTIKTARVIVLVGEITDEEFARIKRYLINAVESREAAIEKPDTLSLAFDAPPDVEILNGFTEMTDEALERFMEERGLAMSFEDLKFCRGYFKKQEKRDPSITEIKVIDTYWSDHCRHTTFTTKIEDAEIEGGQFAEPIEEARRLYLSDRAAVYGEAERDITLMDIATIGMKRLRKMGKLDDLDVSEEINACSIVVSADVDGEREDWLVMFKNETHNHPTEIEPFGGAATCLGGAIRDPLSGRSYVYQAMRVTGAADPRKGLAETMPGKLPQKKITLGAADGYSSYGNQIGLATGQVTEVYHENFVAKRLEVGAVIAAAPKANVARETPTVGDVVVLVGGRTGRDGCGGATGSSKEHTEDSLATCGAEVQKGNAPTERKLQRLFRNPEASLLIKRCNDFGAGGVCVAIGELTDGLVVDLDAVPKKYEGLDGTELAISESQERMAVVIEKRRVDDFIRLADAENLEAKVVAFVSDDRRLKMLWRGREIVDLSRDFLDTNGVKQSIRVKVAPPDPETNYLRKLPEAVEAQLTDLETAWLENLKDLNVCSQKGLAERFDSTVGGGTVLMPFGGKYQSTPAEGMVAKLPARGGNTNTATAMTFGFNPHLMQWSPFHGAAYAIVEAAAKIVALGGRYDRIRLSLQEYFEKLGDDPLRWGKPFSALLGALWAQRALSIPAIGGKDSMSGTYKDIDVPPSLIAFAVAVMKADQAISPEFKQIGSKVVAVLAARDEYDLPDFEQLKRNFTRISELAESGKVLAAQSVRAGGVAAAVSKMAMGNGIGLTFCEKASPEELFRCDYGTILLELGEDASLEEELAGLPYRELGITQEKPNIIIGDAIVSIAKIEKAYESPLEKVFPAKMKENAKKAGYVPHRAGQKISVADRFAKPRVFIPVFPGTNCEDDAARAFEKAGGIVDMLVVRNLTPQAVEESIGAIVNGIKRAQIVMLPGGFSAGDEPDGSGKFIAAMLRNPRIKEAITRLLKLRDGLMLGVCNGFQALIKLGLLPHGEITELTADDPTLTRNQIGRHISCMARTKVVSNLSPWFSRVSVGDVHTIPFSHGEGRFAASPEIVARLRSRGQIATQYVDFTGNPTLEYPFNPNGSAEAIEGITSPDGRILGKMGHSERIGESVCVNVPGEKDQKIFESGVYYYK